MAGMPATPSPAAADENLGLPTFTGPGDPVPAEPVVYRAKKDMMRAMYRKEKGRADFWMDRLLARHGRDPAGNWLMTRGRAVFMKQHDPGVIGFGGQVAYWESIDNRDAYAITVGSGDLAEDIDRRVQYPSRWTGVYTGDGLRVGVTKFVSRDNVAVTNLAVTNETGDARDVPLTVTSPYTTKRDGDELTGTVEARNDLTTIFPRLSGDHVRPDGGKLAGSLRIGAGETVHTKVVMGFVTEEISASRQAYEWYRKHGPAKAEKTHVRTYNRWWAENVPYIDVPDENLKKFIYYRWWLMRYNFLDANIPGNDYQFPTSMEGVLGYNNAIVLTIGMFVDDLKYLRNPIYSYGPWVSAGEVSGNGKYTDNPGDPENWSNSYTQYISESALQSYQIHGGQPAILRNLARYASSDVYGQLEAYDSNDNGVIEYDWGAMVGNDADAVSFHYYDRANERTESAYVYSNARAAARAYGMVGNKSKAQEMREVADRIRTGVLENLWNGDRRLFEHRDLRTGNHIPWKEINNYYPYAVGLVPNEERYREAFRLWGDPEEYPIFPFYTANQADKAEAAEQGRPGTNNFSQINSTVNLRFLTSALRHYPSEHITPQMYKKTLYWNAWAHFVDGNTAWPDSNEFWADWNPDTQTIDYRSWIHHTILGSSIWTFIEDAMGLRPRSDRRIELWPIGIGWDHFTVNNINYHGRDLTIVWDAPGDGKRHYRHAPEGYSVYLDGKRAFTVDRLTHLVFDPDSGKITFPDQAAEVLHVTDKPEVPAATDVALSGDRAVDMFAKAGVDLTETGDSRNVARGGEAAASHTASGTSVAGAVDGFTINEPYWGSRGSGDARDWYALDFGEPTRVDDVKLYFYTDRDTYTEPAMYSVQYRNDGEWVDVHRQRKTPTYPRDNYNHVRFRPVETSQLRVVMTHQPGHATGLKEVQALHTGARTRPPRNQAPYVLASEDTSFSRPGQVRVTGVAEDDGLPSGDLDTTWRLVEGPGVAIFDDENAPTTVAHFSEAGQYTLELTATDGRLSSSARVTVEVAAVGDRVNVAPSATPSASYTSPWEDVTAINDGIDPPQSNDDQNPRWGTWPEEGTQWSQLTWEDPVRVDSADVYFFDDGGGVRVPASWKIQYWDGDSFVDVGNPSGYPTEVDSYNEVGFEPVTTSRLRIQLASGAASVGLLEWKAYPAAPERIRPVHVPTLVGEQPELPSTVTKVYADGSRLDATVTWESIPAEQLEAGGTEFPLVGLVGGTGRTAEATVYVRETDEVSITRLAPAAVVTVAGTAPELPETVTATFNDGSKDNVTTTVTWEEVDPAQYAEPGTFTVTGTVEGATMDARAEVTVR